MKSVLLSLVLIIGLSSCKTLVPYSQGMKELNNWNESQLRSLQFYNSETIILNRQLKSNSTDIVSGKVKMVDGREVEEIIIKRGTPGIVAAIPDANRLAVSYEISDDYFLTFGVDPKRGDRYYLRLKDYEKNQYATVTYSGKTFNVSPMALNSFLQVNMKQIKKEQKKLRVAKGRKL